ncbi:hypothetical protein [Desulfovibrio inopinatus]|uniref:hypothetical protein n=1 Tax=Desulfovibrio inopinatus TaxID=102109 RepID=UPI00048658CD|nr:hypothetical protein [Desulfovibrio inopinatus]
MKWFISGGCLVFFLTLALNVQAATFQCVRPGGHVVCSIESTSSNPSSDCNAQCFSCNLVCAAVLTMEKGQNYSPTPSSGPKGVGGQSPVRETPGQCRKSLAACQARCKTDPSNTGNTYAMSSCMSACQNTFSGCGTGN